MRNGDKPGLLSLPLQWSMAEMAGKDKLGILFEVKAYDPNQKKQKNI